MSPSLPSCGLWQASGRDDISDRGSCHGGPSALPQLPLHPSYVLPRLCSSRAGRDRSRPLSGRPTNPLCSHPDTSPLMNALLSGLLSEANGACQDPDSRRLPHAEPWGTRVLGELPADQPLPYTQSSRSFLSNSLICLPSRTPGGKESRQLQLLLPLPGPPRPSK